MNTIRSILLLILISALFNQCKTDSGTIDFQNEGYVSLFNGNDLTGWKIPEGDNGHWKVIDGVIDYDAMSESDGDKSLYTEKNFINYKLHLEWRFKKYSNLFPMPVVLPDGDYARDSTGEILTFMMPNSDSGILMRGGQQVQVWCWGVGSGELWGTRNNQNLPPEERANAVPEFHADNPVGEWNTYGITLVDDRVTVYLNDILVIENGLMPDLPDEGPIGFQHHGGMNKETGEMDGASSLIQFRNIWIKEI